MPRIGKNIYKRRDGRWKGRYIKAHCGSGKVKYGYLYARTYHELQQKMFDVQSQSSPAAAMTAANPAATFRQVAGDWILSKEQRVKESTMVKYRNLLRVYLLPALGDRPIAQMDYDCLDQLCNTLLARGGKAKRGLSPKTVSDALAVVRNILRYAADRGNPPPLGGRSITIKREHREMRVLSKTEQQALCRYLFASRDSRDLGLLICLFTGLRIGEICALKWGDFSFPEKTLFIHQAMQRIQVSTPTDEHRTKIVISTPKSECSIRTIPLPEPLLPPLLHCRRADDAFVLTGVPEHYIEPRTMQNHFKRILKECGIADANFHSLRHSFASRCVEVGFDIKSLSEILGHASVTITMNRYVHPTLELKRENMNRLTKLFAVK